MQFLPGCSSLRELDPNPEQRRVINFTKIDPVEPNITLLKASKAFWSWCRPPASIGIPPIHGTTLRSGGHHRNADIKIESGFQNHLWLSRWRWLVLCVFGVMCVGWCNVCVGWCDVCVGWCDVCVGWWRRWRRSQVDWRVDFILHWVGCVCLLSSRFSFEIGWSFPPLVLLAIGGAVAGGTWGVWRNRKAELEMCGGLGCLRHHLLCVIVVV